MKNTESAFISLLKGMMPKTPEVGDFINGKIITVEKNMVYVDLGLVGTGIVYGKEFKEASRIIKNLKPGDKISAIIVEPENEEGFIELSIKEAEMEKTWKDLKEKMASGEAVETKILGANKGGLMIEVNGISGFIPVSQLSPQHYPRLSEKESTATIASELKKFVGKTFKVKIIALSRDEQKLIASERAVKPSSEESAAIAEYKINDVVEGEVTGIMDFGVFARLDENTEGLVHISELDWQIINNPEEIVKKGERIKAKIMDINNGKISLSIKALKENPWEKIEEKYKKGQEVEGEIVKHNPYGAFVQLDKYIHGLVHISELRNLISNGKKLEDVLKRGQKYTFEILSIVPKEHRLTLKPMETA